MNVFNCVFLICPKNGYCGAMAVDEDGGMLAAHYWENSRDTTCEEQTVSDVYYVKACCAGTALEKLRHWLIKGLHREFLLSDAPIRYGDC